MAFKFSNDYYSKKFSTNEKSQISRIMGIELKKGKNQTEIIKTLKDKGLNYWDKNMSHDIRRKQAIMFAQSDSAKKDAGNWFDNTFEIFRSRYKLTSNQADKIWKKAKENGIMKLAMAENETEFWDLYKGLF